MAIKALGEFVFRKLAGYALKEAQKLFDGTVPKWIQSMYERREINLKSIRFIKDFKLSRKKFEGVINETFETLFTERVIESGTDTDEEADKIQEEIPTMSRTQAMEVARSRLLYQWQKLKTITPTAKIKAAEAVWRWKYDWRNK